MKILVNVFHPNLSESKINRRMMEQLKGKPGITVRDMYEEYKNLKFRDVIPMDYEKSLMLENDRIVFQHPIFWYGPPPLFKKWIEDIIHDDWAWGPKGNMLKGKDWLSAVSCAGDDDSYRAGNYNSYSLDEYLRALPQIAKLCKMHYNPLFSIRNVFNLSEVELSEELKRYEEAVLSKNLSRDFDF